MKKDELFEQYAINKFKADAYERLILMLSRYLDDNMKRFVNHHLNQLKARIEREKSDGHIENLIKEVKL